MGCGFKSWVLQIFHSCIWPRFEHMVEVPSAQLGPAVNEATLRDWWPLSFSPWPSVQKFISEDRLPHLLLYGPPGTGKTSTILACAKQLYKDKEFGSMVLEVNGRFIVTLEPLQPLTFRSASFVLLYKLVALLVVGKEGDIRCFNSLFFYNWHFCLDWYKLKGSGRTGCLSLLLPTFTQILSGCSVDGSLPCAPRSLLHVAPCSSCPAPEGWAVSTASSLALWFLVGFGQQGPGRGWGREKDAWSCPGGHHRPTASPPAGHSTQPFPHTHPASATPPPTP